MEENICDNPAWTMDMGWAEFVYVWRLTQLGFKRDDFQQQKIRGPIRPEVFSF